MDLKFIDQAAQSLFNSLLNSSTDALSDKKTKDIATTAYHRAMILYEARKSFQEEVSECQCEKELPKLPEREGTWVSVAKKGIPVPVFPVVVEEDVFTEIEDKPKVKVSKTVKAVEDSEVVCSSANYSDQPAVAAKRGRGRPKKVC